MTRSVTRLVTRLMRPLAALALLAALGPLAGCGSDAGDAGTPEPQPTTTTAAPDPTLPSASDPGSAADENLCQLFREFADAQSQYVGDPTPAATEALVTAGLTLVQLPVPDDLDAGGHAALVQLVRDTLTAAVPEEDLPVVEGTPDQASFSAYLDQRCPA